MTFTRETKSKLVWSGVGTIFTVVLLIPVYLIITYSFETLHDMYHMPPYLFPPEITFEPIVQVFTDLRPYLMNSFINALGCLLITLLTAPFAAYALAIFELRYEKHIIFTLTLSQMFPVVMLAIPIFLMYSNVNFSNTYLGLILANATYTIPFCTIVLTSYMRSVPFELIEAAYIDGASPLVTFFRVVAPVAKSGIATISIFGFLFPWADFIYALVITTQNSIQPMSVGLYKYIERYGLQWNNLMAGGLIFSIPALLVVILTGRFIIGGLTAGAVKQ